MEGRKKEGKKEGRREGGRKGGECKEGWRVERGKERRR